QHVVLGIGHGGRVVLVVVDAGLLDLCGELGDALLRQVGVGRRCAVGAGAGLFLGHRFIVTHGGEESPCHAILLRWGAVLRTSATALTAAPSRASQRGPGVVWSSSVRGTPG